jgi:pilus assembly protein CpaF
MAGTELPSRAVREQIGAAINVIVHQNRLRDGSRKITHITEIQGMESDVVVTQDIFLYHQKGVDEDGKVIGAHEATGLTPKFLERIHQQGITLSPNLFKTR